MHVVYDVSHNIAKIEEHVVDGKIMKLLVHRKGSTSMLFDVFQCLCEFGGGWEREREREREFLFQNLFNLYNTP